MSSAWQRRSTSTDVVARRPVGVSAAPHVEVTHPGGIRLLSDTEATIRSFDPVVDAPTRGPAMVRLRTIRPASTAIATTVVWFLGITTGRHAGRARSLPTD